MAEPTSARAARLADELEVAYDGFIRLVESLSPKQWATIGVNFPYQINNEDEGRPVGVIAHHVAVTGDVIVGRIQSTLAGLTLAPIDFTAINAAHAREHADVGKDEVLAVLRESKPRLAEAVRVLRDEELDLSRDTAAGPLTIKDRVERVLIGHLKGHQGSIEAALR